MPEQEKDDYSLTDIDEHNLSKECTRLPTQYRRFAFAAVERKKDVAEIKAELAVIEADLSKMVRATPEKYGLEKLTETGLSSTVKAHPKVVAVAARLREAEYKYDLAQAAVWTMEHKKRGLSLAVDLAGMGMFPEAKITKEGKEAVELEQKRKRARTWEDD